MAWIKWVNEDEASGTLGEIYRSVAGKYGSVDNILKIHRLNPASLRGHYDLYRSLMYGKSELTRVQRELIAVAVSRANNCHY